jgi:hypothetical protein
VCLCSFVAVRSELDRSQTPSASLLEIITWRNLKNGVTHKCLVFFNLTSYLEQTAHPIILNYVLLAIKLCYLLCFNLIRVRNARALCSLSRNPAILRFMQHREPFTVYCCSCLHMNAVQRIWNNFLRVMVWIAIRVPSLESYWSLFPVYDWNQRSLWPWRAVLAMRLPVQGMMCLQNVLNRQQLVCRECCVEVWKDMPTGSILWPWARTTFCEPDHQTPSPVSMLIAVRVSTLQCTLCACIRTSVWMKVMVHSDTVCWAGWPGFDSFFPIALRLAVMPTQPLVHWGVGTASMGHSHVAVKVLCDMPEGHGFETWGECIFFKLLNPSGCTRPWGLLSL